MTIKLHVAVLMGGWSAEREISLITGNGVADALESRGHRVTRIDMDRNVAAAARRDLSPDVVFNALHGTPGEDGTVQGMMDLMGLRYTHSGLEDLGDRDRQGADQDGARPPRHPHAGGEGRRQREPLCRRPAAAALCAEAGQRGLVGRRRDRHARAAITAIRSRRDAKGPWQEFDRLLAEPFIAGRELTVAVLDDEALAVTELQPKSGFYDYDAKYTDGHDRACLPGRHSRRHSPTRRWRWRSKAHRLLGCKGASRSDFRWDDEQGEDGPLSARGQHPAGDDALEPGARAGARARGIDYADAGRADRGGGVMSARIARRAARRARPAQGRGRASRGGRHAPAEEAGHARELRLLARHGRGGSAIGRWPA